MNFFLCCTSVASKKKKQKERKKEVFHIRKRKKTHISNYQLEGTLVLDIPLAAVYICADHNYLLSLVLDRPGLHLEHMLDQQ
jgi:hypothetical protein